MTIHIGYDREEDKIELILASQGNVISTLAIYQAILVPYFNRNRYPFSSIRLHVSIQKRIVCSYPKNVQNTQQ